MFSATVNYKNVWNAYGLLETVFVESLSLGSMKRETFIYFISFTCFLNLFIFLHDIEAHSVDNLVT